MEEVHLKVHGRCRKHYNSFAEQQRYFKSRKGYCIRNVLQVKYVHDKSGRGRETNVYVKTCKKGKKKMKQVHA